MSSRRRRLRLLLTCSLGAILSLSLAAGVVRLRANASWGELQARGRELEQRVAARDLRRELLWGEASPGQAFDHYDRATSLARELSHDDHAALIATLRMDDATVTSGTAELRARWRPVLDALRAGARCEIVAPPRYPADDPQAGIPNLLACRWVTNMAVLEARTQRLAGHPKAAVQWSLDAATFACDTLRRGPLIRQMISCALISIAGEAWTEPALRDLGAADLELLATGLARLDAQLPRSLAYEDELLFMVRVLEAAPEDGVGLGSFAAWRYGFSSRWMVAAAFRDFADAMLGACAAGDEPWSARKTRLDAALQGLANSNNPAAALMAPNLTSFEQNLREVVARVRMLRIAVELHRGNAAPRLDDPCGDGPIAVIREEHGWRLRSAAHRPGQAMERIVAD